MFGRTVTPLKPSRRQTSHVWKYLEGCPLPETLVDDIAGANLRSSAPLFSTIPRYIVTAESRLSKLFFHHALYPAGGARCPCRVVVVRGGRGVRVQSYAAAPATGCGGEGVYQHKHRDPARRSFFYARPPTVDSFGGSHGPTSPDGEDVEASRRVPVDGLLSSLCGVIEDHFTAPWKGCEGAVLDESSADCRIQREKLRVALAEVLSGGQGGLVTREGNWASDASPLGLVEALLKERAPYQSSSFYVHAQLPPSALFMGKVEVATSPERPRDSLLPQHPAQGIRETRRSAELPAVVRLAGGLEPVVHFAVGTPLSVRRPKASQQALPREGSLAMDTLPFGHVQCLLHVRTRGARHGAPSTSEMPSPACGENPPVSGNAPLNARLCDIRSMTSNVSKPPSVVQHRAQNVIEPWKLGISLDPKVPLIARTVTESRFTPSHGSKCSGGTIDIDNDGEVKCSLGVTAGPGDLTSPHVMQMGALLGRDDCETYLLPQRELLLTFHVPEKAAAMCAAQNEERLRRQAALGYSAPSYAFAEGLRTSARVLQGAQANIRAAEVASSAAVEGRSAAEVGSGAFPPKYEVRALPGDAIFVPRGWQYSVERIVGTAVMDVARRASPTSPYGAPRFSFRSGLHSKATVPHQRGGGGCSIADIVRVEVDAFVLCYKPYPVLTKEQAATYVAANYVQGGIDEFYEKGGNNVYHKEALELVKKWDISLLILVHGADTGSTTAEGHQLTCDNIPDFYSARRIHGRKVINTQFQFGCEALRNSGLLQRCALEAVLEESRLSAVAVVHYVEEGSAGHKLFTDAVPEGSNIVPRLHVFPPMVRGAPRTLLHGITLTPLQICIAVRTALQPLSPAEVTAARDMVLQHIDDMNMVWEKLSSSAPDTCGVSSLSKTNTTGAGNTGQVGSSSSSTQAKSKVLLRLKDSCGEVKSSSDARAGDACGGQETVESCGTEGCRVECGATATTGRRELEAAGRPPEEERQAADVPPASSTAVRKESVPATAANSSSGDTINLRCRLPAGDTHIVRNLNPSTATLSADVRGPVAAVVGSSAFVFARPHPPQRFTEEEENKTLESLEIRCSSNILVFPSEDSSAPAGVLQRGFYGGREVLATVSTLFNRVHHSVSGSSAEQPVRSWFRTMADTHEEDEAEDRSERQQDEGRRPSKANRYFGGGSTFYVGKDDSDEESLDEGEADKAKKKQ